MADPVNQSIEYAYARARVDVDVELPYRADVDGG
jgi:hypothetical protein